MSGDDYAGYIWVQMGTMGSRDTGEHKNKARRDKNDRYMACFWLYGRGNFPKKTYVSVAGKVTQMGADG
jgi:hypothetical protein